MRIANCCCCLDGCEIVQPGAVFSPVSLTHTNAAEELMGNRVQENKERPFEVSAAEGNIWVW